jgi:hypothetical protein
MDDGVDEEEARAWRLDRWVGNGGLGRTHGTKIDPFVFSSDHEKFVQGD